MNTGKARSTRTDFFNQPSCSSKMFAIFAATFIPSGGIVRLYAAGFFYACTLHYIYGFVPPCGALMRPLPLGESQRERRDRFFILPKQTILSEMTFTEKDCLPVNNSSRTSTPGRESAESSEKQLDFSAFHDFLKGDTLDDLVERLQEIRATYLELSLHVLMELDGLKPLQRYPHKDVEEQASYLSDLINLFKTLRP